MKEQLKQIAGQIVDKRAAIAKIGEEITALKNEAIKHLPFQVGDCFLNEGNYQVGMWLIEKIFVGDKIFSHNNKIDLSLQCRNIKKDGSLGEKYYTFHFWSNLDIKHFGNYEEWLKNRK